MFRKERAQLTKVLFKNVTGCVYRISLILVTLPATTRSSHPRVVNRRRHGDSDGGGGDITDDGQGLCQGLVGPQHLIPPLSLLLGLVHQGILVTCRVQLSQQLCIDEVFHLVAGRGGAG